MAFCTGCGKGLPDGVRFCPNCGIPVTGALAEGSAASAAQPAAPPAAPPARVPAAPPEDSVGGLAKRWLRSQLNVTGDPMQGRRQRDESDRIADEMRERVDRRIGQTAADVLIPAGWKQKMQEMEHHKAEQQAAADQARRAAHEARPRSPVQLTLSGAISGIVAQPVPIQVQRPSEPGDAMTVSLEPLEPIALGGGHTLLGLQLAVPRYAGQGTYDLAVYEVRDDWDGTWFQLSLDTFDDPFYWTADYGPGVITVDPDERTLRVRIAMQDSGSRSVILEGAIPLP